MTRAPWSSSCRARPTGSSSRLRHSSVRRVRAGLELDEALPGEVEEALRVRGYDGFERPEPPYYWGSVQALEIDHEAGEVSGARDPRREGDWQADRP